MQQQELFPTEVRVGVAQFNKLINLQLQSIGEVIVEGEITEFNISKRQGVSIVLKDKTEQAIVSISGYAPRIEGINLVEQGMEVAVWGVPQIYSPYGKFCVAIYKILPIGEGALIKALELLKSKLEKEGLFDVERKRELPKLVRRIALITAKDSAAQSDFLKILKENNASLEIDFYPVAVQGKHAVGEVVNALQKVQAKKYDCLVLIRGGGSLEDLSAFNDESVARAVFASKIVTIVAVGHEKDESIAELAADIRASTPSQAAYYLIANAADFALGLNLQIEQMSAFLAQQVNRYYRKILSQDFFERVLLLMTKQSNLLASYNFEMETKIMNRITYYREVLNRSSYSTKQLDFLLKEVKQHVQYLDNNIQALNPSNVLKRGYALVENNKGKIVTSIKHVKIGEELKLNLKDGKVKTAVRQIAKF